MKDLDKKVITVLQEGVGEECRQCLGRDRVWEWRRRVRGRQVERKLRKVGLKVLLGLLEGLERLGLLSLGGLYLLHGREQLVEKSRRISHFAQAVTGTGHDKADTCQQK